MIEKEYKGLLDKNSYERLAKLNWTKKFTQINFYYGNNTITDNKNLTIRVRAVDNVFYLQIKVKTNSKQNIMICNEYEKVINSIPQQLSVDQIKEIWQDYPYSDVSLEGFLITERYVQPYKNCEIMLDKNLYNGLTDYEIEIEYNDDTQQIDEILAQLNLSKNLKTSFGKYGRFKASCR